MKYTDTLRPAVLGAALTMAFVPAARAVPAVAGDLILGFRATGENSEVNVEVNLGPASNFYGAAAGTTQVLTSLSVQDLIDKYGDGWAGRSDLFWGIAGTTGPAAVGTAPARTIWASRAEAVPGTASLPWPQGGIFTLQVPSNTISSLYTGAPGSLDRFAASPNSAASSYVPSNEPGSWTVQETFTPGVSFRYFNPSVMNAINTFPAAPSTYDGTSYTVLDIWDVRPGAAGSDSALIGAIGLNAAGKLVFSTDVSVFGPGGGEVELGSPDITRNANGSMTITLTDVPAGNYILERSTSMDTGSWADLTSQSPSGGILNFNDPAPPQPRGFYRIKEGP